MELNQVSIKCRIDYKTLALTEYNDLYKENQDILVEFTFSSDWDGLAKTAVVHDTAYEIVDDKLLISSDLVTETIKLSVYSTGTKSLVTNEISLTVKEKETSSQCEAALTLEDIEQIVTKVNEKTQEVFAELNANTQEAFTELSGTTQEALSELNEKTQQALTELAEKTDETFTQINAKLAEIIELINAIDVTSGGEETPITDESIIGEGSQFAGLRTANELVDATTVGWNLAGTLEAVGGTGADQEISWGMPKATKELFDTVKAKGFNAVRLPVTWSQHIDWETVTIDSAWMERVAEVIGYVLDNDMLCIINTHHDHSSYMHANGNFKQWLVLDESANETVCTTLKNVWTQIANRFKDYDGRLIFEGWNEVQHTTQNWVTATDGEWNSLNNMSKVFVDTVRGTGGNNVNRCLIINPPMTSDTNIDKMIIPEDVVEDRILISGHPYDSRYGEELEDRFPGWDSMREKGIAVIFGEVGTSTSLDLEARERNALNYTARAKQHGIPVFWWDDNDRMLLNRGNNTWQYETVVDKLILGASSNPEEIIYTAVYTFNDNSYWEAGKIDENTGERIKGKYNSKILKENIATSEGHVVHISISSHDNGFQMWTIAFYDADGNYVYGIYKASMYNVSFVCPPTAVSFNITVWNPWGTRTDAQWISYFENSQLSITVKEEETAREWVDERLHIYDAAEVDLNDFSNWRIGQYQMTGGYTESATARICVKGLLKIKSNVLLDNTITNADGTTNTAVRLVLRTYDSNNDLVDNLGAWPQGVIVGNGTYGTEIGVSMYFVQNSSALFEDYQALFDAGLNVAINMREDFSQLVISGSECLKGTSVNSKGLLVANADSYRALPLIDVSAAEREIAVLVNENSWRFCQFDENMNVLNYKENGVVNSITMLDETKYIRISGSKIYASTSVKIAYKGEITVIPETVEE